ncbi:MAG: hemerythrin family protein [Alphaproteobacteria bacterium]|nr:hemerythrin family protein [Alphaproteobacteria bacterium]MBF0250558.1 hemerythrin family protein [Alphaproteobacteria bacterium]
MRGTEWTNDMSVGIGEIDRDHRKLVSYLNELGLACMGGQGTEILEDILQSLVEYTRVHFANEEDIMRKVGYPDFDEHRERHARLVSELDDLMDRFHYGVDDEGIAHDAAQFLEAWLVRHILVEDRKIGRFVGAID